jgi:Protein of unknown function (DUF2948)
MVRVPSVTAQLKLMALDADDLVVISAHVQDARVRTSDIIWRQGEKRLVVGMNRLDWEQKLSGETTPRRLIAALRFDRVLSCKSRNINLEAPETALELVGIEFPRGGAGWQRGPDIQPGRGAPAGPRMSGMRTDRPWRGRFRDRRSRRRYRALRAGCLIRARLI